MRMYQPPRPKLVFSPRAWLKLQFLCHRGPTEVGGFAISSANNPLYVEDFHSIAQRCTSIAVRFLDQAVADFFDDCVDQGLAPEQFGRIWCHTHPGASPIPSWTDEETFDRCFGSCHWSVMFILSRTSKTYARISLGILPGFQAEIPVRVDWKSWPDLIDEPDWAGSMSSWEQEYRDNVEIEPDQIPVRIDRAGQSNPVLAGDAQLFDHQDFVGAAPLMKGG